MAVKAVKAVTVALPKQARLPCVLDVLTSAYFSGAPVA